MFTSDFGMAWSHVKALYVILLQWDRLVPSRYLSASWGGGGVMTTSATSLVLRWHYFLTSHVLSTMVFVLAERKEPRQTYLFL